MTRLLLTILLTLSVVAVTTGPGVVAQTPAELPAGVEIDVGVERDGDTIGDLVHLTVTVTHPADGELLVPPPEGPLGDFEPAAPTVTRDAPSDSTVRVTLRYETRAFVTDVLALGPPELSYRVEATIVPIQPPPQVVDVRSLLPEEGSLVVRPLKPAEEIPKPEFPVVAVAVAIGLPGTLLAAAVIAVRRRRRSRPAPELPAPAAPDPGREAARDLEGIGTAGLLPQSIDEFCARVNVAVRGYLADRYQLPAFNLTARELGERLARAGADAGTVQRVRNLCQACDDIAYAGATPNPDRVARYLDLAHAIVQPAGGPEDGGAPERWAPPAAGNV